ncbi:MAG: aminotransferase class I/II-fold pyridoxal phosphate-dependent enzyme [Rhodospirillales bacterium]
MVLKASRRGNVPPFIVMDVMRAAAAREAEGENVLHLEVGQPATGAPAGVVAAAREVLGSHPLGYTVANGIPSLRDAIARHYRKAYGQDVDPNRVFVTAGSSAGFLLGFLAAFDPGDRVALASPGYPAYRNILSALGLEVVDLQVGDETNFQPTPEMIEAIDGGIDGLIVASPSNPTGTMLSADDLRRLCETCDQAGIRLISDEIYHGITYREPAETALRFTGNAIIINSFSKYFSMTGWRLGWMILPDDLRRSVECLAQNLFISPPGISQYAAVTAFDCEAELDANVARYAANREVLLSRLPAAGLDRLASADGAFYVYADVSHLTDDSEAFCRAMLNEAGVAATPGTDFDPGRGHHFVRFSFAGSTEDMVAATDCLENWLAKG